MTITARIEKDSIAANGVRLTTFVLTYPRFIHCFDERTEVLCEIDGIKCFLPWKEAFNKKPKIANYHKDQSVTFSHPSHWISNEVYEENMVEIKSQRISMLVTEGHRLYVGSRKQKGDTWEVIKAKDMLNDHTQKRFTTFGYINSGENIGKLSNLIGFFVGDGTIPKKGKQIVFHLKKDRKINYLINLLKEQNILYEVRPYSDGTSNIVISDCKFFNIFKDCYDDDGQKKVPPVIHTGDSDSFRGFLDGLWNSDGSTDKGYLKIFNTSSRRVADDVCTLASIHGMRINFKNPYGIENEKHRKIYKLTNCTESQPIIRKDKHPAQIVKYTGKVYCATVDSGLLIVRRDGLVHVSGNCEFMTHRVFSRNASSSRAIPFEKQMKMIEEDMAMPLEFRKNQKGMQAGDALDVEAEQEAQWTWLLAGKEALKSAQKLADQGVHKQYVNRLVEPFAHITVVVTATEYANFFALRHHSMAQPEIADLAKKMWEVYSANKPTFIEDYEWHLPFVTDEEISQEIQAYSTSDMTKDFDWLPLIKRSVARCARVSYNNFDGSKSTFEQDCALYDRLLGAQPLHSSCAEHQAKPFPNTPGVLKWSANFRGYEQFRKTLSGENITTFEGPLG